MPDLPYHAFALRTNPFSPEIIMNGQPICFDYSHGPLMPHRDTFYLNYYFDLYRWSDPDQIGLIGHDGRVVAFPDRFGQPGMIIVISGVVGTGRTSLENLLLFEVTARAKAEPIQTRYTIEINSNKVQAAQNFASVFIQDIEDYLTRLKRGKEAKSLARKLKTTVKEWRESLVAGETNSEFLFHQLTRDVRRTLPDTPIVFCLDATNHMNTPDTWRPVCIMLRNLADFVVLSLSKRDHASYLRTSLRDNQIGVVWIDAPRINAVQTIRFLEMRLSVERTAKARVGEELFPFTEGAIKALFAPAVGERGPVALSIDMVIKRLKGAFEKKCKAIAGLLANQPGAVIPTSQLQITDEDMRNYFSR